MHKESFEDIAIDFDGERPEKAANLEGPIRISEDNRDDDDGYVVLTLEEAQFLADKLPEYISRIEDEREAPKRSEVFYSPDDETYIRVINIEESRDTPITHRTLGQHPGWADVPPMNTQYQVSVIASGEASRLTPGTTAWIDEDAIKDKCERVTSNRSLAFLNAGRMPEEWKTGDIRENVNTLEPVVVSEADVRSHQSLLKGSAPICFVENRLDY